MADKNRQEESEPIENPPKRQKLGRKWEQERDERLTSHVMGPSCDCKRLKCFQLTNEEDRTCLLSHFNSLPSKDSQDSILASMIVVKSTKRKRPRLSKETATCHEFSYSYWINIMRDELPFQIQICMNALISIFGIGKSRLERIRASLAKTGHPPKTKQGKHSNRPHAFSEETVKTIIDHIRSFKGSPNLLTDSSRLYLPKDLNLSKMHSLYQERYPDNKISRESYRKIFTEKFHICFDNPRASILAEPATS